MQTATKPVIGILGGIGAGKSTVAGLLAELGCAVIDADRLGHEVLREPEVKAELVRAYGAAVLDAAGEVDRKALAGRVFAEPQGLDRLNGLTHPLIRQRIAERIGIWRHNPSVPAIVLDAALLLETDWRAFCTHLLFVRASAAARAQRANEARGWNRSDWARRENSQKPLDIKESSADYVVDNNSSLSCLREQVHAAYHRIVHSAE